MAYRQKPNSPFLFDSATDRIVGIKNSDDSETILTNSVILAAALAGIIASAITDGDTTHVPSGNAVFDALALKADLTNPAFVSVGLPEKTPVNAVASTGVLTSGGTNPKDAETVTIDTKVYTFRTALTPTEGEVLIGVNTEASLTNLKNAINHEGTPDTDYKCAAVHPTVTCTASDATTVTVAAKVKGVSGDAIATSETMPDAAWGETHLESGVNGTVGVANEICADASYIYHCVGANTIAGTNWRRIARGPAY